MDGSPSTARIFSHEAKEVRLTSYINVYRSRNCDTGQGSSQRATTGNNCQLVHCSAWVEEILPAQYSYEYLIDALARARLLFRLEIHSHQRRPLVVWRDTPMPGMGVARQTIHRVSHCSSHATELTVPPCGCVLCFMPSLQNTGICMKEPEYTNPTCDLKPYNNHQNKPKHDKHAIKSAENDLYRNEKPGILVWPCFSFLYVQCRCNRLKTAILRSSYSQRSGRTKALLPKLCCPTTSTLTDCLVDQKSQYWLQARPSLLLHQIV